MKATVLPLGERKYYGTMIEVSGIPQPGGSGDTATTLKVWLYGEPSARQLADWGMTYEQAVYDGMMCDGHYESQVAYDIAKRIADALTDP